MAEQRHSRRRPAGLLRHRVRNMVGVSLHLLLRPRVGHGRLRHSKETIMITDRTLRSFLNCPRKAFLQIAGSPGEQPDIRRVELDLEALYKRRALETFLGACQPSDVVYD